MEEILHMKPRKTWDKQENQLVQDFWNISSNTLDLWRLVVFSKVWRLRRLVVAKQFEFLRFNVKTLVGGTPPREVGFQLGLKKGQGESQHDPAQGWAN